MQIVLRNLRVKLFTNSIDGVKMKVVFGKNVTVINI